MMLLNTTHESSTIFALNGSFKAKTQIDLAFQGMTALCYITKGEHLDNIKLLTLEELRTLQGSIRSPLCIMHWTVEI